MNSLLVAWKPILIVVTLVIGGLWMTGHHDLALVAGGGFVLLMVMLLTGNLGAAGLITIVVALTIIFNFTGHIHYNPGHPICQDGYHWNGPWVQVWAVGQLEFRIHPYYCAPENRYDPREFKRL